MANNNLLLEEVRNGFVADIQTANQDYLECKNSVIDETSEESQRLERNVGLCFGEWDADDDYNEYQQTNE